MNTVQCTPLPGGIGCVIAVMDPPTTSVKINIHCITIGEPVALWLLWNYKSHHRHRHDCTCRVSAQLGSHLMTALPYESMHSDSRQQRKAPSIYGCSIIHRSGNAAHRTPSVTRRHNAHKDWRLHTHNVHPHHVSCRQQPPVFPHQGLGHVSSLCDVFAVFLVSHPDPLLGHHSIYGKRGRLVCG